jgi:HK97 family phage prohead protease
MDQIEYKSIPCELKAVDDDKNRISGRAAVLHNIDSGKDIIAAGAFKSGLSDPSRIFVGGLNHNWDQPIARVQSAHEVDGALEFESGPIVDTTHGNDVKKLINAGIIDRASIGYKALEFKHLNGPDEVKGYWKSVGYRPSDDDLAMANGRVRLLTNLKLFEVSPVTIPMNERATIAAVKCGMGCMGMGGGMFGGMGYGPTAGLPILEDVDDRIRDFSIAALFDYLMLAVNRTLTNDMVSVDDRFAILDQLVSQWVEALKQTVRPRIEAENGDDAVEALGETLESLGKQFRVRLEAAGVDVDTKSLASLESGGLDDFLPAVESAVGQFLRTHRDRLDIRLKEGRTLSASNVDRLRKVRHSLHGHVGAIDDMLRQAGHEPGEPPTEDEGDGAGARRRPKGHAAPAFPSVPAAAGTQPLILGGKAAPAGPDLSAYFVQFHATDPALLGIDVAK